MKAITKIHEYATKYLHDILKMEPKNIAKELEITVKQVQKILNIPNKQNKTIPTVTSNADNKDHLMINKTLGNRSGVSIMTGAASAKGDELMKNAEPTVSRIAKNAIFRPKN
jgi:selenocysteine lyase/cysteine desulfurase